MFDFLSSISRYDAILLVVSYVIGSIPFGLIFSSLLGHGDIRKIGSGNIGTANAFRTGNKLVGVLTLMGDLGKGAFCVFLAGLIYPPAELFAVFGAVIGHVYPIFLKFKGGKGVATAVGAYLVFWPITGFIFISTWIGFFAGFKYSSLASLSGIVLACLYAIIYSPFKIYSVYLAITILILYCHRENIQRLLNGTENKINF